jgi:hypothetical protein
VTGDGHWSLGSLPRKKVNNSGSLNNAATSSFDRFAQPLDEFQRMNCGAVGCERASKNMRGIAVTLRLFSSQQLQRVTVAEKLGHVVDLGSRTVELHLASSEGDGACLHLVGSNAVGLEGLKEPVNALLHRGAESLGRFASMTLRKGVIARRKQR